MWSVIAIFLASLVEEDRIGSFVFLLLSLLVGDFLGVCHVFYYLCFDVLPR